jgi:hypothetical protein
MSQTSATASSNQAELFPNQSHSSNSVEARDQDISQNLVMIVITNEGRNLIKYLI